MNAPSRQPGALQNKMGFHLLLTREHRGPPPCRINLPPCRTRFKAVGGGWLKNAGRSRSSGEDVIARAVELWNRRVLGSAERSPHGRILKGSSQGTETRGANAEIDTLIHLRLAGSSCIASYTEKSVYRVIEAQTTCNVNIWVEKMVMTKYCFRTA